jgi:hypothetical protein
MSSRYRVTFLVWCLFSGCAGARPAARGDLRAATLVAYGRPTTDVTGAGPARGLSVKVERLREGVVADPARMMEVRRSMERQISLQVHDIPEERYRGLVRPRLERALLEAGLTQADADCVLGGVDYHRSL